MLNAGLEILLEGFNARLDLFGEELQHTQTGAKFKAILEPVPPIDDPDFVLGSDIREKTVAHILQSDDPGIKMSDILTPTAPLTSVEDPVDGVPDDAGPVVYKVIHRIANPADFVTQFWLVKVTTKDAR